jgi:hypothetical protein
VGKMTELLKEARSVSGGSVGAWEYEPFVMKW